MEKKKVIILRMGANEYEFLKNLTLGDVVIFTALGQVVSLKESKNKIIYTAKPLSAIVDAVPNQFKIFEDEDKNPKEIF